MKISIVTAVYNDPRIARALGSIISQQHDHELEIIVVDGASTQETQEAINNYRSHITVFISEPDEGIYQAMNKGIAKATGDIIGILNADDQYSDTLVLRDVTNTFGSSSTEAVYGDLLYVNESGQTLRYWKSHSPGRLKWYRGWMPPHPTFFVRREVYDKYGVFDLDFGTAADYELMLRLVFKYRVNTAYIDRVLVHMATGGTTTPTIPTVLRQNYQVFRAWRHNDLRFGLAVPFLKVASKPLQFFIHPRT